MHDPPFEPFFLAAQQGKRFCIYHPAAGTPRGGVIYVHPFAEEMNKSRRMAALQAQALAAAGYSVLQIDLFGCGDSSGDFSEARWEIWQKDVALGVQWLSARTGERVTLWGLRLGALLALDAAQLCHPAPVRFLMWQPVLSGEALLTQFLRLRLASEMLSEGRAKTGVTELRAQLAAGHTTEVAGYALSPELAACVDKLRLVNLAPPSGNVHWFEVIPQPGRTMPPASRRVADSWIHDGILISVQCTQGPSFWNTVDTSECPDLISATTRVMQAVSA
jgi:exosortase A-associated hydrolase 2